MKRSPLLWALRQTRRRAVAVVLLLAAQIVNALLGVYFALGSSGVIDAATSGERDAFFTACIRQGAIVAGILLSLTLTRHLREYLRAALERDRKRTLLHGLLHGEYADVSAYHSAELLNRLNNDVSRVNDGLLSVLPAAAAMLARLIASVAVLRALDGTFSVVAISLGVLVLAATALARGRLKELNRRVNHHDGLVSAFLQESMENLLLVQAMDVSAEVERRSDRLLDERYAWQRKRKNVSVLANTCVSVLSYGSGFLALCWCARRVMCNEMSVGSLTAIIHLVAQLQAPFVNLSGVFPQYTAMLASAERLMELEQLRGEPAPCAEEPAALYRSMDGLRAEGLSFSYGRDPVLRDATFFLPKGAFAVVTGTSGVGKSTLLKLLLGIFHPESGGVYLDRGGELLPLDRTTRRLFAYVPQGNLLLSGTIRENLTIVCPEATEAQLARALYAGAVDEFLPTLPLGLDTPLGESGAGLSEGQAQRICIARAVLGGAPILLLDECTSALDEQTEQTVLSRLCTLPGRTCIVVTHRSAAVRLCDYALRVQDGRITASAVPPAELLQDC